MAAFLLRGLLNVFPLPRTVGFRDSFAHAGRAMDRGYSVLIFPEGRRGPDPTATLPFKPGLGILAQEAYLDVVPAALRIVPKSNGGWLRSHPVVHLRARMHVEAGEDAERLTERFEQAVQELLREDSV